MNRASELFDKLRTFKQKKDGVSPEQQLMAYCNDVLGEAERLHFDFKEKRDRRVSTLHDDDRLNIAKAVSGFANSAGGVLIWGIADKTLKPKPISDVQNFLSRILETATSVCDPLVLNIDGEWISSDDDADEGYAFLYIPESDLPPHRVISKLKAIKNHYYQRSCDSFRVATHTQLEDMFGRRPHPNLVLITKPLLETLNSRDNRLLISIELFNRGRGIAKSPYIELTINSAYKVDHHDLNRRHNRGFLSLRQTYPSLIEGQLGFGGANDTVIHSGLSLGVIRIRIGKNLTVPDSLDEDLKIDFRIAS